MGLRTFRAKHKAVAATLSLLAACWLALAPALHARFMPIVKAPPGFIVVCTALGTVLVPADPALPPPEGGDAGHGMDCSACTQAAPVLPVSGFALAPIVVFAAVRLAGAPDLPAMARVFVRPGARAPPVVGIAIA